jgi:hypothetical protein
LADPIPRPRGQRRRRNLPDPVTTLPAEGSGLEAPELPGADELLEWTRNYWVTLWDSPMAVLWNAFDTPALIRLARVQDLAMRGEASAAELSEIRQLEDRFGLSPLARRRLQWEIAQAQPQPGTTKRPAKSPQRRLRAV